jgi:hypothetical protein
MSSALRHREADSAALRIPSIPDRFSSRGHTFRFHRDARPRIGLFGIGEIRVTVTRLVGLRRF